MPFTPKGSGVVKIAVATLPLIVGGELGNHIVPFGLYLKRIGLAPAESVKQGGIVMLTSKYAPGPESTSFSQFVTECSNVLVLASEMSVGISSGVMDVLKYFPLIEPLLVGYISNTLTVSQASVYLPLYSHGATAVR